MITLFKDSIFQDYEKVFEPSFSPSTKVIKNETEYSVLLGVPGLTKDDLKISIKEGIIKISYEKNSEEVNHHFINSFTKSYYIPDDVKEKDIEGKVENGVLKLTLPIDKKKSIERTILLN